MLRALSLRDQLAPIERELADIWKAKAALGMEVHPKPRTRLGTLDARNTIAGGGALVSSRLTIKGMVVKALDEHFRGAGGTTQELVDFFRNVWGQDVDKASLSAQLSRLNLEDGVIVRTGEKWILLPELIGEEKLKNWGVIPPWAIPPDRFKPK